MADTDLLRLKRIEVDDLFGVYNHHIDLDLDNRITLLHGQNGVGKTSILRMADAILRDDLARLKTIPFSRIMLGFHDGSTLELSVRAKSNEETHTLSLKTRGKVYSANINLNTSRAEVIAAQIDFLRPHETLPDVWVDIRDGEALVEQEVLSRFGNQFPIVELRKKNLNWFSSFLGKAKVHLIEVQRLVRRQSESVSSRSRRRYIYDRQPISSVVDCSEDFRKRLDDTMASYGRNAQTLDQSFPQRLISADEQLTVEQLQSEMETLDKKTADLKDIGILDATPVHPFDFETLGDKYDPTQALVMTLYVRDTAGKLKVLDDFADRTRLFLGSVNAKFQHKQIRLDRQKGLVAKSDKDESLELDYLSSGEQHELVLHYDLLFRVPPNTVVMIDEPELSLHVAWQKRFLPDLIEIVQLSGFDVLIATHSPFIVGDRDDLMVALGNTT